MKTKQNCFVSTWDLATAPNPKVSNMYCSLVFGSSFDIPAFPECCSEGAWADSKLKPEIGNSTHQAGFKEQHLYYWTDKTIHMPYLSKWIERMSLNVLQNRIQKGNLTQVWKHYPSTSTGGGGWGGRIWVHLNELYYSPGPLTGARFCPRWEPKR